MHESVNVGLPCYSNFKSGSVSNNKLFGIELNFLEINTIICLINLF